MTQAARLVLLAVLAALPVASARADATAQTVNPAGEKLYKSACVVCHASGAANAPKLGDRQVWAPYAAGAPTRCWPRCSRAGRHAAAAAPRRTRRPCARPWSTC